MFLSKRSNGIYCLWHDDELGIRYEVASGSRLKSHAVKFLVEFRRSHHERKQQLQQVSLSQLEEDLLSYSKAVRRPKSVESF